MKVKVVASTPEPIEVCLLAARNDYYMGDIVEDGYAKVMKGVDAEELLKKLMLRGHWGVLEHASFTFHAQMSRGCMAQLTRHRLVSFDIQSMRYVNFAEAEMFYPHVYYIRGEDGIAVVKTRKGVRNLDYDTSLQMIEDHYDECIILYDDLVEMGMPEEDARNVLPIGTKVNVVGTMNLRTAFHLISMRGAGDAQAEIRDFAAGLAKCIEAVAPQIYKIWKDNKRTIEKQRLSP